MVIWFPSWKSIVHKSLFRLTNTRYLSFHTQALSKVHFSLSREFSSGAVFSPSLAVGINLSHLPDLKLYKAPELVMISRSSGLWGKGRTRLIFSLDSATGKIQPLSPKILLPLKKGRHFLSASLNRLQVVSSELIEASASEDFVIL